MTTKKILSALLLAMALSSCSTTRTAEESLHRWYPNHDLHQALVTSALEKEARDGSVEAEIQLAIRFMNGDRAEQDQDRSFRIFESLAKAGDARAQYFLGVALEQGAGIEKNPEEAMKWFRRSAEKGYDLGQYWYAFMLSRGRGVPEPDWEAALPWFRKAANQGHQDAQFSLGEIHESCRAGLDRDFNLAAYWYRRADSEKLHQPSRYNLSRLINLGLVPWKDGDPSKPQGRMQVLDKSMFRTCDHGANDPSFDLMSPPS